MILRAFQHLHPLLYEDTIFTHQVHDVTHCGNSNIFHEIIHIIGILLHHIVKGFHQFVCNSRAAQALERISTVRTVRIYDSVRLRKKILFLPIHLHIRHFMMICHNNRQTVLLSVGNLFCCRDPVVAGYNRIDPVVKGTVNEHFIEPVPILDAVGNVRVHICAQSRQSLLQDVGGIDSVDIIVPDHPDRLILPDLLR